MTERLLELAMANALRETASEIRAWAASKANRGPWEEELYRTNIQIGTALEIAADKITRASQEPSSSTLSKGEDGG